MSGEQRQTAAQIIQSYDGPHLRIMEVCGTHTHENFRLGVRKLLPPQVDLISGPGCPVCVTPVGFIDEAIWLAGHGVTITTFGDLVRVPGTRQNLADVRANGGKVQVVYSPLDALAYAKEHADEQVAFLSVGFETTVPAACLVADQAVTEGVGNFSLLTANKTMPNAYAALRDSADVFLYPGHVHAIIGTGLCESLAEQGVSGVLAGFTAKELVTALAVAVRKAQEGKPFFVNAYPRVVKPEGTPAAVALIRKVMEPVDTEWRGLGVIPQSGLALREAYQNMDARKKFDMPHIEGKPNPACRCGEVLRGVCKPSDCPLFGKACTPLRPVGACMVSSEGACSAYYQYGGDLL
ncbi:MAG: hydrogenase formation protein HypD [Coriobacteriales bacterium]|nr:hydrogenase formation protein HypD [Coriobacteriales bacterium]